MSLLLEETINKHPFLTSLDPSYAQFIVECASVATFDVDEFLLREGEDANQFFLIYEGKVVLTSFRPQHHYATIQTITKNNTVGWSWLIPPYKWHFSARVVQQTKALVVDGERVRQQCDEDCSFGYQILKQVSHILGQRLRDTRMRLR